MEWPLPGNKVGHYYDALETQPISSGSIKPNVELEFHRPRCSNIGSYVRLKLGMMEKYHIPPQDKQFPCTCDQLEIHKKRIIKANTRTIVLSAKLYSLTRHCFGERGGGVVYNSVRDF